jgi:hypothetical protein
MSRAAAQSERSEESSSRGSNERKKQKLKGVRIMHDDGMRMGSPKHNFVLIRNAKLMAKEST